VLNGKGGRISQLDEGVNRWEAEGGCINILGLKISKGVCSL